MQTMQSMQANETEQIKQPPLELTDIQGIVLTGYGHLSAASYVMLQIGDAAQAKQWLGQLAGQLMNAAPWPKDAGGKSIKPTTAVNIGFGSTALGKLNVPTRGFSNEFIEGIVGQIDPKQPDELPNRARRLGDTGQSAPTLWEFGGPGKAVDVVLMLFAEDLDGLNALRQQYVDEATAHGLTVINVLDACRIDHNREPFGFHDGLSQPNVEGYDLNKKEPTEFDPLIRSGEFVFGYYNEYGLIPPMPEKPGLGKNGSYLVLRKLEQDVAGFWNYVFKETDWKKDEAVYLAAKMVGRWPSGTPLTLSPHADDPALQDSNEFLYADKDHAGYGCPVGSHVRRVNPRDALQPSPDASMKAVKRHRMLRRGRVYGPQYTQDVFDNLEEVTNPDGTKSFKSKFDEARGLIFISVNADIRRQFEFIQQTWVNDPKFDGLYDNRDPLVGDNSEDTERYSYNMTIQRDPARRVLQKVPRFVTVKGGGYFFVPGINGLKVMAS